MTYRLVCGGDDLHRLVCGGDDLDCLVCDGDDSHRLVCGDALHILVLLWGCLTQTSLWWR